MKERKALLEYLFVRQWGCASYDSGYNHPPAGRFFHTNTLFNGITTGISWLFGDRLPAECAVQRYDCIFEIISPDHELHVHLFE